MLMFQISNGFSMSKLAYPWEKGVLLLTGEKHTEIATSAKIDVKSPVLC